MRELWVVEVKFTEDPDTDQYWKPQLDLVYETGQYNAEQGALQVELSNPGVQARAVLYTPERKEK